MCISVCECVCMFKPVMSNFFPPSKLLIFSTSIAGHAKLVYSVKLSSHPAKTGN